MGEDIQGGLFRDRGGLDAGQREADVGGRAGYDRELPGAEVPVLYAGRVSVCARLR